MDPFPEKPKGMHCQTYDRLQQEAEKFLPKAKARDSVSAGRAAK